MKPETRKPVPAFVRIWGADDGGESAIHLLGGASDYTICGHDAGDDPVVHGRPCKILPGMHRVTCRQCLAIISDVRDYIAALRHAKGGSR